MGTFILRRMILLVFVLFGISVLVFGLLMTYSPERRAAAYITSPQQAKDIPMLVKKYGLDKPFYIQYFNWLKQIGSGNFGWSNVASQPVAKAFWYYFPITLELNLIALPIVIFAGIWIGTLAGVYRDSLFDHSSRILAVIGYSMPVFLFALILLMIFYGYFHIFPPGMLSDQHMIYIQSHPEEFKKYTGMYTVDGILNGHLRITWDALNHLVAPVFAFTISIIALNIRVMRSGMIEELSKDYIITAQAKGADKRTIVYKHAQRNALLPVITISGQLIAASMAGSIQVEMIFNRCGIGYWLANSAMQLDMPVLMFMCIVLGVIVIIANLLVDIFYAYIDPRIRLS